MTKTKAGLFLIIAFLIVILSYACESEQSRLNNEYRTKLASLKINMSKNHVKSALGEPVYHVANPEESLYVEKLFYRSPDSAIGFSKCYFNRFARLVWVEWDSVYLDKKKGGAVIPMGRKKNK